MASESFVIEGCILSYPHIFAPQQVMGQGDPKYSATLLVPQGIAGIVYQKAQELAAAEFRNGETQRGNFRWPVAPASGNPSYASNPRLAELFVINAKASADYPPQVVDERREPVIDRGKVYAGCVVAALINLYAYNNMGNVGIGVGLKAIMKTGDGEPLGGEVIDAKTAFAGVKAQAPAAGGFPGGLPAPAAPANPFGQPQTPASNGMPAAPFPGDKPPWM